MHGRTAAVRPYTRPGACAAVVAQGTRYIDMAAARRDREVERRTRLLLDYLTSHPCVDCGETDPTVLEFDHIGQKRFGISVGLRARPSQDVLDEIEACEVVCANCHRRRTYRRGNVLRFRLGGGEVAGERGGSYLTGTGSLRALAGVAQWQSSRLPSW